MMIFPEVVLRSPGRYDVPCPFEAFNGELLQKIDCIANELLSDKAAHRPPARAFAGTVRASPGSEAQIWHADSPHASDAHRGPHLLNVLVATQDLVPSLGPTELVPGSHILTNHLREGAQFGTELLYQSPGNSPELVGAEKSPVLAEMAKGSVLVFDDRILHRGGGNTSKLNRDVVFFSYSHPSFEHATHYEAVRSLETYDHRSLAETVRSEFPGLRSNSHDAPVLADGASGSQLHTSAIQAVQDNFQTSYKTLARLLQRVKGKGVSGTVYV